MILSVLYTALLSFSSFSGGTLADAADTPAAVTVALIGAAGVIGGSWIDSRRQSRRLDENSQARIADLSTKLDDGLEHLERRLDGHLHWHGEEVRR